MFVHAVRLAVLGLVALVAVPRPVHAQEPISDSKRQLILELVGIYNEQTSLEKVVDAMLGEMEKVYPSAIADADSKGKPLTDAQKQDRRDRATESFRRYSARFRERMVKEIDLRKVQDDISIPLYDHFFTEDELRDLIAFYHTPTGQKTLRVLPELLAESIRRTQELIGPAIQRIAGEVLEEEKQELERERTKKVRSA